MRLAGLQYIQELYEKYEYEEVGSPNIYNFELWNTSGHAAHYKENMFVFQVEKQEFGLKPMNCPGVVKLLGRIQPHATHTRFPSVTGFMDESRKSGTCGTCTLLHGVHTFLMQATKIQRGLGISREEPACVL